MTRVFSRAVLVFGLVGIAVLAGCRDGGGDASDAPEQPIAFYHNVHAGDNQIPCMYCHTTAERSPNAGIPSVQTCVGCHVVGSGVTEPGEANLSFPSAERDSMWNAEATKLVEYWRLQEPIPWARVYDLPEHVRFTHSAHVRVGLECQTCHGPVEEMEEVYQVPSLQMGWCIACHTGQTEISPAEQAAVDENSIFKQRVAALAAAGSDTRALERTWPDQRASVDCFVCHY